MAKDKKLAPARKPIDKAKVGAFLTRLGGGIRAVSASHPASIGIIGILGIGAAKLALYSSYGPEDRDKHPKVQEVHGQLTNMHNALATILELMAAVPIATAAIGAVGGVLTAKAGAKGD